jgi:hypothetical protein
MKKTDFRKWREYVTFDSRCSQPANTPLQNDGPFSKTGQITQFYHKAFGMFWGFWVIKPRPKPNSILP